MNPSINLFVLRCNNIEESKAFYEWLGFSFIKEQHGKGPIHYSTKTNGIILELYPRKTTDGFDNIRLGFSCPSLKQQLESVDSKIVSVSDLQGENNDRVVVVKDPDGRSIELVQTKEG